MLPASVLRLAFFGPPGAGKGTQARLASARFGLRHISTGRILRVAIKEQTAIGRVAQTYIDKGSLVPDEVVRDLAEDAMRKCDFGGFILDGYPRTERQAKWLMDFLGRNDRPMTAVVHFVLSDDEVIARLSRRRINKETGENFHLDYKPPPLQIRHLIIQRRDDRPEAIRRRLGVYEAETQPVAQYFQVAGLIHEIDALGSFETVHERVCSLLGSL